LPPPGAPLFPWPHPNFWWANLWCLGYLFCTQLPAGVLAAVLLVIMLLITPGLVATDLGAGPLAIMQTPGGSVVLAVAVGVAHGLGILLSLAVLRLIGG